MDTAVLITGNLVSLVPWALERENELLLLSSWNRGMKTGAFPRLGTELPLPSSPCIPILHINLPPRVFPTPEVKSQALYFLHPTQAQCTVHSGLGNFVRGLTCSVSLLGKTQTVRGFGQACPPALLSSFLLCASRGFCHLCRHELPLRLCEVQ